MKRVCVYCGSSSGNQPEYIASAHLLAKELTTRNIVLVYGGASVGIMGAVADSVLSYGGEVIGVMPQSLVDKEISHSGLTQLKVVDSMHQRKALMADLSDGFIALPGGLGTIEELFEMLTWSQLGFHRKPCALLNIKGYYQHLKAFINHATQEGFVKQDHCEMLLTHDHPGELLDAMINYQPRAVDKWITKESL